MLDHWQISGITSFVSGSAFTPTLTTTDGHDITGSAIGPRITVTGDPNLSKGDKSFTQAFNASVFQLTPVGSFGNAGNGRLRGPGINNWDVAVSKRFPLKSESRNLQFRAELFNAWNHTQFSAVNSTGPFNPAGTMTNPLFGSYTAAYNPRIIQLSLRFAF